MNRPRVEGAERPAFVRHVVFAKDPAIARALKERVVAPDLHPEPRAVPGFQRLECALAPRLLEAEVLGGRAVRRILKAADPRPTIRKGTS